MATVVREPDSVELTEREGRSLLDERARRYLGMSAEEFLRGWREGDLRMSEDPRVVHVALLIPFVVQNP
jgi:hypothetical protein